MKTIISILSILFFSTSLFAEVTAADAVVGVWKNGEGTGIIKIYKTTSGHYAGKIVWLKEPIDPDTKLPKLDKRNPDASLRAVPTLGLVNMKNFLYNETDKNWEGGTIYDPKNGKEYSCKMELVDANTLNVRGYMGVSLFGRTDTWTRQLKK
jgi:uncharacterized protein (DUF2147 family)